MIFLVSGLGKPRKFSNEFFCEEFFYVVILLSKLNHSQKNSIENFPQLPPFETALIINLR